MSGNDTIELIRRGIQRAPLVTLSLTFTLLSFWLVVQTDPEASVLTQQVIERWGNSYLRVAEGELWRLFTYAFIHATPSHVLFNLVGILILGTRVERLVGHVGLMSLFLGAASLGGLLSFIWRDYELSIGASGALYGLLGAELIFIRGLKRASGVLMERRLNLGFMLSALWLLAGLFLGILSELNSEASAVDHATHFASFFSGGALGWVLLWARSYRLNQDSVRGVLSALSPLLMSLTCVGVSVLLRPTPPGFGGLLYQLRSQELSWRQQQRALTRLSPAEQREVWGMELSPPLTQVTLALDELIEKKLTAQATPHQLAYAQDLSRYLNLWLVGARALSQEPLDLMAPPLAQLRAAFDLSRGRGALLLAEVYREHLSAHNTSKSELTPITLQRRQRHEQAGDDQLLSTLLSEASRHARGEQLERLDLLDWVALISLIQPQREAERQLAAGALSACLLSRLQREGERDEWASAKLTTSSLQSRAALSWERCQGAAPEQVAYGSLLLSELLTPGEVAEKVRWLRFTLELLTRMMSSSPPTVERSSPPTRLTLPDTVQVALNQRQLYTLWSQLAAQALYDQLSEGGAEPLDAVGERWWTLVRGATVSEQALAPHRVKARLSWVEPPNVGDGQRLQVTDLAPGPEGLILGVYRMESGQHWLIEVPVPARLTTQSFLISAVCSDGCAALSPELPVDDEPSSANLDAERPQVDAPRGYWVAHYHLSGQRRSSLPMINAAGVAREEEEPLGWRAWPIGVSDR